MSRVAIVIPVYNGARFLREAVQAALRQTRPPDEVVVVDDGSRDDSARVAREAGARVIEQRNQGTCAARNVGIEATKSELLIFTDHDDRLRPDAIAQGIEALERRPECGLVYGFSSTIDEEGRELPREPRQPVTEASYERMLAGDVLVPPGCAMFRRDVVAAAGGFREGTFPAEDYDLYLRVARLAPVFCHNHEIVEYRKHGSNASRFADRQLRAVNAVLDLQLPHTRGDPALERAVANGRAHWGRVFASGVAFEGVEALRRLQPAAGVRLLSRALRADPRAAVRVLRHFARRAVARSRGAP